MVYSTVGEFSDEAIIQTFTASAAISKGAVCTVTPAATSTVATCANSDASGNAPYAVAIEDVANGAVGRFVIFGEVAVDASGNCYKGAYVYGKGGSAVLRDLDGAGYDVSTDAEILGRVTEGAADGGICTVFVGIGGV